MPLKVCFWCARVIEVDQYGRPSDCPHCAATGHLYRLLDDGAHGIAWLRQRWQDRNYRAGLDHLARAEQAYRAALADEEVPHVP